jgi:hypothetical protein
MQITSIGTYAVWGGARNVLFVTVDTDKGIAGVEFDREAAKAHPFRLTKPSHLRRPDGSFTNW